MRRKSDRRLIDRLGRWLSTLFQPGSFDQPHTLFQDCRKSFLPISDRFTRHCRRPCGGDPSSLSGLLQQGIEADTSYFEIIRLTRGSTRPFSGEAGACRSCSTIRITTTLSSSSTANYAVGTSRSNANRPVTTRTGTPLTGLAVKSVVVVIYFVGVNCSDKSTVGVTTYVARTYLPSSPGLGPGATMAYASGVRDVYNFLAPNRWFVLMNSLRYIAN